MHQTFARYPSKPFAAIPLSLEAAASAPALIMGCVGFFLNLLRADSLTRDHIPFRTSPPPPLRGTAPLASFYKSGVLPHLPPSAKGSALQREFCLQTHRKNDHPQYGRFALSLVGLA